MLSSSQVDCTVTVCRGLSIVCIITCGDGRHHISALTLSQSIHQFMISIELEFIFRKPCPQNLLVKFLEQKRLERSTIISVRHGDAAAPCFLQSVAGDYNKLMPTVYTIRLPKHHTKFTLVVAVEPTMMLSSPSPSNCAPAIGVHQKEPFKFCEWNQC